MSTMNEKPHSRLYTWALEKAHSPKAPLWIGLLFTLELILFIPLDPILFIFLYAGIATVASLASGLCGYFLGHFLWDWIGSYVVPYLISSASFERVSSH